MEKQLDLYWTFRSPYCYLVGGRLLDLVESAGLTCRFKPVNPMAVKVKDFFKNMNPLQARYVFMDIARTAERLPPAAAASTAEIIVGSSGASAMISQS